MGEVKEIPTDGRYGAMEVCPVLSRACSLTSVSFSSFLRRFLPQVYLPFDSDTMADDELSDKKSELSEFAAPEIKETDVDEKARGVTSYTTSDLEVVHVGAPSVLLPFFDHFWADS